MAEISTEFLLSIDDIDIEDAIPIQLNNKAKIKIANAIINSIFDLDILELKLICILASQKFYSDEKVYRVSVNELGKLMNLSQKNRYTQLRCLCTNLLKRSVQVLIRKNKNKISWLGTPWFHFIFYDEGVIYFSFHPLIRPYITMLKSAYLAMLPNLFMGFRSIHAARVYFILRSWFEMGHNTKTLSVESIKMLFCITAKYKSVTDLMRFCILPAIKEIEKLSSLRVNVLPIKTGSKITEIAFEINEIVDTLVVIDNEACEEEMQARKLMEQCNCSSRTINRLLTQYSTERIIRWTKYTLSQDGIKKPAAYLTELLKRDSASNLPAITEQPKTFKPQIINEKEKSAEEIFAEKAEKIKIQELLNEVRAMSVEEQEQLHRAVVNYSRTINPFYADAALKNGASSCINDSMLNHTYAKFILALREREDVNDPQK